VRLVDCFVYLLVVCTVGLLVFGGGLNGRSRPLILGETPSSFPSFCFSEFHLQDCD
jgi:hypothetical protein